MNILFTTNNDLVSKLIRATTGEDISHVAIEAHGFICHASSGGVQIEPKSVFCRRHEIIDTISVGKRNKQLMTALSYSYQRPYDYFGVVYLGLKLLARKVNISLPKKNLWHDTGMYFCTEFITHVVDGKRDSMLTPGQLRDRLRGN